MISVPMLVCLFNCFFFFHSADSAAVVVFAAHCTMPSSFTSSATQAMESVWKCYRFKDPEMEDEFLQRSESSIIRVAQLWSVLVLLYWGQGTLASLGHDAEFYLPVIPIIAVAFATLVFASLPNKYVRVGKCIRSTLSIAALLVVICHAISVHFQSLAIASKERATTLREVFEALESSFPAGVQQLDDFLEVQVVTRVINMQTALATPQILVVAYIGFSRKTCMVILLMLLAVLSATISPIVPFDLGLIRLMGTSLVALLVLGIMARQSWVARCSFFCERSFEAALETAIKSGRQADSILSHKLKNTMADAAGDIEFFLQAAGKVKVSTHAVEDLKNAHASLLKGMKSCQHRQVYLGLVSQAYVPAMQMVQLKSFADQLMSGRQGQTYAEDVVVLLDPVLVDLILDNLISNAFKHGASPDPDVQFHVTTRQPSATAGEEGAEEDNSACGQMVGVTFLVSNTANADRPRVTEEYVQNVLAGKVAKGPSASAMSDYIGLQHSFLAAEVLGMTLSVTQSRERVVARLEGTFNVGSLPEPPESKYSEADMPSWPEDVHIYCIDDSAPARRLLYHNLTTRAQTRHARTYGKDAGDVTRFMADTLQDGAIAILDQNLEFGGDHNLLGTDLVAELIERGFQGLICIRSANATDEDARMYKEAGAHCVFGKDTPVSQVILQMKRAFSHLNIMEGVRDSAPIYDPIVEFDGVAESACGPSAS